MVIGVHAPSEFAFERDIGNVKKAMTELGINYPVAIDNDYKIWHAFNNQYWPAHYFADAKGQIRYHHFGEGEYAESERVIQQLLREAGAKQVAGGLIDASGKGVQQAAGINAAGSPETYLGYQRSERFVQADAFTPDQTTPFSAPKDLTLNQWGLQGRWNVGAEHAQLSAANGRIIIASMPATCTCAWPWPGRQTRALLKVSLDGQAPGNAHGMDVAPDGSGEVTEQRLYQLVRQSGDVGDHTFSIEFLDPNVSAYAFTFG